jgi:hypothetical protein
MYGGDGRRFEASFLDGCLTVCVRRSHCSKELSSAKEWYKRWGFLSSETVRQTNDHAYCS